jgi:hypothetical protein
MAADEQHLKELMKTALIEVLSERRDLLSSLIEDVIEDMGLLRAMEGAESTETVSMEAVRHVLRAED